MIMIVVIVIEVIVQVEFLAYVSEYITNCFTFSHPKIPILWIRKLSRRNLKGCATANK